METSKLEQAFALILEAFAAEYHRGEQDAMERLQPAIRGLVVAVQGGAVFQGASSLVAEAHKDGEAVKTRVRRGMPEAFARRVLAAAPPDGLTLSEIVNRAETPEEKAISYAAVRVCLWRAEKKGWATAINGKWALSEQEEKN